MIFTGIALIFLGLCFGSFVNALVWRLRQQEINKRETRNEKRETSSSIIRGRSICPHCHHELAAKDLIPVLSRLFLRARCRYCGKPISIQYPLVELAMAAVFVSSYILWPQDLESSGQLILFISWLGVSVGLMALAVYDWRWMILPNRLIYPTLALAAAGRLGYIAFYSDDVAYSLSLLALSLAVASGFFWLVSLASAGKWIGHGDIRLGWILGTVLADPALAVLMIFTASVLGSLTAIPQLIEGSKKLDSKLPFGPFLIAATFITLLFGSDITQWYRGLLT